MPMGRSEQAGTTDSMSRCCAPHEAGGQRIHMAPPSFGHGQISKVGKADTVEVDVTR